MEKQNRIWNLLVKKDRGEASEAELLELERLLVEQPDIQHFMKELDHYWESIAQSLESEQMMTITDGNRLVAEMKLSGVVANDVQHHRKWSRNFPGVAAVILTLVCATIVLYYVSMNPATNKNIVRTNNGSRTEVTLPDGTWVILNGGSMLSYPDNFKHAATREVTISGEAYFDVKHDSSHPFVIHTQYLDIKDIGTVFNVKAYPNEAAEATLISGSIEVNVRNRPEEHLRLRPKEKVVYNGEASIGLVLKKQHNTATSKRGALQIVQIQPIIGSGGDTIVPETAWTQDQLVFQSEPFASLAGRMERWYNVKFHFKSADVQQFVFTGIFKGETLEQSLHELQMSRAFDYDITKDSVIVSSSSGSLL